MSNFNDKAFKKLSELAMQAKGNIVPPNPRNAHEGAENANSKKDVNWEAFCDRQDIAPLYTKASLLSMQVDRANKLITLAQNVVRNPCNVLVLGGSGRGKTYYLHALMREFLEKRTGVMPLMRYFRALDLDGELLDQIKEWKSSRHYIKNISAIKYLFIDDWGTERATEKTERDFLDLIDRRIGNENFTFITTNLRLEDIQKVYGARLSSRLKEFMFIRFDGADLRKTPVR